MTPIEDAESRGRLAFWLLSLGAAAVFLLLIGLGTWQLQRLAWKEGLIEMIEWRTNAPPVSLAAVLARQKAGDDIRFSRVSVTGVFDHEKERYLYMPDPRLGPGFDVLAPLELADGAGIVFVNRGFVPEALVARDQRKQGLTDGVSSITGIIRLPETQGAFVPDNDAAGNLWFWRDVAALSKSAYPDQPGRVLALSIDAEEPAPGGWPNGGGGQISLSNRHFSYALTWFGLAGTLIAVYIALVLSRRRRAA